MAPARFLLALCVYLLSLHYVSASVTINRIDRLPYFGNASSLSLETGYLPIDLQPSSLFFWFAASQSNPQTDPVVLWLNGGPGCSSMVGFLTENGPLRFMEPGDPTKLQLTTNLYSWTNSASVLWIDQPTGTGLSFADPASYQNNETIMAQSLYNALVHFFVEAKPELKTNPFFISGESYAGKYIPRLATWILAANKKAPAFQFNLKGVLIGDGLVDPIAQRLVVAEQAYANGLLSAQQRLQVDSLNARCVQAIAAGDLASANTACETMYEFIDVAVGGGLNMYDLRNFQPFSSAQLEAYLNLPTVRQAIHVPTTGTYQACSDQVGNQLALWRMLTVAPMITALAQEIRVLLYNGNFDLKDGPIGTEKYLDQLQLPGWSAAPRNVWYTTQGNTTQVAGWTKSAGSVSFVTVFGASHFVPGTQPYNSLVMLNSFLQNTPLCSATAVIRKRQYTPSKDGMSEIGAIGAWSCAPGPVLCDLLNNCSFPAGTCGPNGQCQCSPTSAGSDCSIAISPATVPQSDLPLTLVPHKWTLLQFNLTDSATTYFHLSLDDSSSPISLTVLLSASTPNFETPLRTDNVNSVTSYAFNADLEPGLYYLGILTRTDTAVASQSSQSHITLSKEVIYKGPSYFVPFVALAATAGVLFLVGLFLLIRLCQIWRRSRVGYNPVDQVN